MKLTDAQIVQAWMVDYDSLVASHKLHPPTLYENLLRLYQALGVDNQKDAFQAIRGLQERVKFTQEYESLRYRLDAQTPSNLFGADGRVTEL